MTSTSLVIVERSGLEQRQAVGGCWKATGMRQQARFFWLCGLLMEADMGERSRWHPLLALYYLMLQAVSKS